MSEAFTGPTTQHHWTVAMRPGEALCHGVRGAVRWPRCIRSRLYYAVALLLWIHCLSPRLRLTAGMDMVPSPRAPPPPPAR